MELGRSGRLLVLDPATERARRSPLASAMPSASARRATARWSARAGAIGLSQVRRNGSTRVALPHLPGYPSRISPAPAAATGSPASPRARLLVEFVLREQAFRKRMMAEIEPRYWIAPALSSGNSFLEPMQGAHLKMMGVVKPWAPPRSYGLVIRLDATVPRRSIRCTAASTACTTASYRAVEGDGDSDHDRQGPRSDPAASHRSRLDKELARMSDDIILALRKATKHYAGVPAIDGVDFDLQARRDPCARRRERRRQVDLTKVMAGVVTLTSGQ